MTGNSVSLQDLFVPRCASRQAQASPTYARCEAAQHWIV